jgi:dolichyl-phosphate beta-glucosyltransferase
MPADHGAAGPAPDVIVVVPCFNEARRLPGDRFLDCAAAHPRVRFLFVDDGSGDATAAVLAELARREPESMEVLSLPRNRGKAEAIRHGVLTAHARGAALIGYWDADLATPLEELPRFIDRLDRQPEILLVMGARVGLLGRDIRRSVSRHYLGRVFATAVSWLLGLRVYDTQCGAKLFRASVVDRGVFARPFVSRWLVDVEILQRLVHALGIGRWPDHVDCIHELPLHAWRDVSGSKLTPTQMLRAAGELLRLACRR